MKKIISFAALALTTFFYFSCVSQAGNDRKELKEKEKKFTADGQDVKLATDLDRTYKKFIMKYPGDTDLPRLIFLDAQVNDAPLKKTNEALAQYEKVYSKYPDSRYAPVALFRSAFINETVLKNYDKAKTLYALFLKTYPNHPAANDARFSLENIGLTPEQQFQKIQSVKDSIKNQKKVQK
jgi:TolA-binding protein